MREVREGGRGEGEGGREGGGDIHVLYHLRSSAVHVMTSASLDYMISTQ